MALIAGTDPRLHQWIPPEVTHTGMEELFAELEWGLDQYRALGLSAPQIGYLRRAIVVKSPWGIIAAVNPQWEPCEQSQKLICREGCVSYPGIELAVPRWRDIWATWITPQGQHRREHLWAETAQCWQHECDHLDGRVMFESAELNREQRRRYQRVWSAKTGSAGR